MDRPTRQSPGKPPLDAPACQRRPSGEAAESALVDDELVSCFMWASGEPGKEVNRQTSNGGKRGLGAPAGEYDGGRAAAGTSLQPPGGGGGGGGGCCGGCCDASDPEYVKQLEAKVSAASRDGSHRSFAIATTSTSTATATSTTSASAFTSSSTTITTLTTTILHHPPLSTTTTTTTLHRQRHPPPRRCTC